MAPHFFTPAASPPPLLPTPSTMASQDSNQNANSRKLSSYFSSLKPPPIQPPSQQHYHQQQQQQRQPPLPPPPPPPSTLRKPTSTAPTNPAIQSSPFSVPPQSFPTPHPQVTIEPVKTAHIPSLMRVTGLLLPIRYPTSFYSATITDPHIASVSRVAIYHDHPVSALTLTGNTFTTATPSAAAGGTEKVIGGIRCRLEPLSTADTNTRDSKGGRPVTNLYIQTLHLLSPYRGRGIAASLLYSLIYDDAFHMKRRPSTTTKSSCSVSALVKHYNIRTVTAHVHETNEDALHWYIARGFEIQDGVVEGYYRRLKPGGARIIKLNLDWDEEEDEKGAVQSTAPDHVQKNTDDEDAEWEKVDPAEYPAPERLEEYQQIDRDGGMEENPSKRVKSA